MGAGLFGRDLLHKKRKYFWSFGEPPLRFFRKKGKIAWAGQVIVEPLIPFKSVPFDLIKRISYLWDSNNKLNMIEAIKLCYITKLGKYIDKYLESDKKCQSTKS